MTATINLEEAVKAPFGTQFADKMTITHYKNGSWSTPEITPYGPLTLDPAAHVLHYSSACFEGLKAHRSEDGSVHTFRLDRHMTRMQNSAKLLCLPIPEADEVASMIVDLIRACPDWAPKPPGSLYIRPTLIGTLPSIGHAATPSHEACLYVILSPCGDYFDTGQKPLKILIETDHWRTAPDAGHAKTGGNYASALKHIDQARKNYQANQVLFAPNGDVQETGAANFLLINDRQIITKALDPSFLPGVTRDSLLKLGADMGYEVQERNIGLDELREFVKTGEAALSGTAAVLAGIGSFVLHGQTFLAGDGNIGPNTTRLRQALVEVQQGILPDRHGWLRRVF